MAIVPVAGSEALGLREQPPATAGAGDAGDAAKVSGVDADQDAVAWAPIIQNTRGKSVSAQLTCQDAGCRMPSHNTYSHTAV